MMEKSGVSTNNLVVEVNYGKGKKLPQYIAALSVCMGSVAAGTVLGWTGNITEGELQAGELNDVFINKDTDYGWIGSFMTLGAMLMCFPIGFICDLIGRKLAMLLTIIPFSVGWLLIIFANNTDMIFAGRFITGLAGGSFCVSAPLYTSEIAQKEIRGALGSYFQLLLTVGILFAYLLGAFIDAQIVSVICAIVPLVFGVVFFLQPETPVYSLKKGNEEAARKSLRRLRGDNYNIDAEIADIKASLEEQKSQKISFRESFKKKATKKSLLICFSLMFFQQFGGINAVIFYVGTIFTETGADIEPSIATIIVGVMQVVFTFIASLVIDKFGRKILLIISDFVMGISGILLGIYFTLKDRELITEDELKDITFLPILSLCIFIAVFSLGFGPIPWMISAELLPPEIKSNASSAAGTFNWLLAFLVTKFYRDLTVAIETDTTFYIFSVISLLGTVFIYFVVPETKGKSLEQIQRELNGEREVGEGLDNKGFSS
ncbi:facilitated trehalose transporter Tret1-2 -like [Asbolus verrucosus]|uniref:Facilitated trehalose transporter Tret1-2-like n=1 Tax=Asbolus verrucosus TaxID=1661398 RepID=A0A482V935_ASBVE|nr:facilitated trehalose transporter Tret1-2 -like [Asbolus verrucosus]